MYSKRKNIIFAVIVIVLIVGMLIAYKTLKKPDNSTTNVSSETDENSKTDETASVDEEYQKMYEEACSILAEAAKNPLKIKGGYEDRYDSREINSEFISDELEFIDPIRLVRVTFTGYEELEDISEYIGTEGDFETSYYLPEGLNSDGTFYDVTDVTKIRYGDSDYGEIVSTEETRLVGIKLKFTLENLKNDVNKIYFDDFLKIDDFVFLDDGKLYLETMVFTSDLVLSGNARYYISWYERIDWSDFGPSPGSCNLEPKEKMECECVFLVYKNHFDSTYLVITPGSSYDVENFNNSLIKLIPFSALKTLEGE